MNVRFVWLLGALALMAWPSAEVAAQDRRITGVVTRAESGFPLQSAEVAVLATGDYPSALTGEDGRFAVTAPAGEVRLAVQAFGYTRQEVVVAAGQNTVEVALASDVFRLGELIVTGQATTIDRRSATTDVAYVGGDEITRVSTPTVLNSLAGRVAGVNLQTNSGAPGGGIQMQVRGNSTILGGFDPLFVVDGVIYSNASIPSGRGLANNAASASAEADPVNRIADINPADIASIEVLKGAAASSIYGSKASNGVVVITTVRGQSGAPQANITQRIGLSTPAKLLEYRQWTLDSAVVRWGDAARPFFEGNAQPHFDNASEIYGNQALSLETIADVSGGSDNTRYFVSANWKDEEGLEHGTYANRQGLRVNVDQSLGPSVELKVSSVFARNTNNRGWNNNCNNYGCHGYALAYIPSFVDLTKRNPDGTFPTPTVGPQSNPIQLTELAVNDEETNRFTGGGSLNWDAMRSDAQSLRLVFGGGIDAFDQRNDVWTPNELFFERTQALPGESIESGGRSLFFNWNVNAVHDYTASNWSASTSGGVQYEDRRLTTFQIRSQNLLPGQRNVNRGTTITANENLEQERTFALYAQETLNLFDNRVLVQAGIRAERSSVNGDTDRFYVFPKLSGSYRFADLFGEGSELKFRAAYGETGNQPIFGQKFTNLNTPQLGGVQGITVSTAAGNENVEPERLKEVEAGIDGQAFAGRLTWQLTGFVRNTTNLLLQRVPAPSSGYSSEIFNGGRIENRGFEALIGYAPIQTQNTQWVTQGTFTKYVSEVADLAGLPSFFPANSGFGNLGRTFIEEGESITQIVGYKYIAETNSRGAVVEKVGDSAPDFRVGLTNTIDHRAMSLSFLLDWQQGGSVINLVRYLADDGRNSADWGTEEWRPRYLAHLAGAIDPYIEDGSFLKLREVALNFDVPARYRERIGLGTRYLRVGFTARNLLTFQKYSGLDPEVGNFGAQAIRGNLDIGAYPPSRSYFLNISVGF